MAEKNPRRNETIDALFDAILSLETREECYDFFEDLCTVKEISDMAQRLEAAKLLLDGSTYEQIVKTVEISTATISRINRCIQYGTGGYRQTIEKGARKAAVTLATWQGIGWGVQTLLTGKDGILCLLKPVPAPSARRCPRSRWTWL